MYRELLIEKFKPSHISIMGDCIWINKKGQYHGTGDNPAIIFPSGTKYWYKNGVTHRDGGKPAFIHSDGSMKWFENGVLIRSIV